MKREKVLVQSPGKCERLVREREKENKSDGGEGAQSLSVFSSGGVSLLWSQLLYWPLGGKANRTFVLDTRKTTWPAVYLWMILYSLNEHHESQIFVSDCHTSLLVHLFLT